MSGLSALTGSVTGHNSQPAADMLRVDIITLLPELLLPYTRLGVCGRAVAAGKVAVHCWNPRDYAPPPHRLVDDRPYGGGSGMVLLAEPVLAAARQACAANPAGIPIYLTPGGEPFTDAMARELAGASGLIFLCGRYRGIDERAVQQFGGREVSIGDYVLSGGEPAACVILDAVLRHVPSVLGNADSLEEEAFADGLLAPPCYTRPPVFEGEAVPEVLRSGDHAAVVRWRETQAREKTRRRRPDLLKR